MATISLYVSGQTELNDVTEFFQKNLMSAGENPVAFFDGVFYESHQERVGNIVFQDYLIYTDKAVYLWARGANKDFLDRFSLGSVSVNSRNKDGDFATLNLKIRREEKDPVYVIFDMVEIREAELITRLHTVVESTIEDALGVNFRKEIPDAIAARVLQAGRAVCPPHSFSIAMAPAAPSHQDSSIGYGQDLLEQYKASIGYPPADDPQQYSEHARDRQSGAPSGQAGQGNPAGDALKGLENILPTDPAALKRIASSIKDMVGEAPFKLREQVMKDLQHVPGDVATVLTAMNELLANIAGNPQAERFVMTAITTAVRNDGVLGSIGKMLKLTTGFGSDKKQPSRNDRRSRSDNAGGQERRPSFDEDDDSSTIRRKKISIKDDDAGSSSSVMFTAGLPDDEGLPLPEERIRKSAVSGDDDSDNNIKRKKISIKAEESSASALVRDMMAMDTPPSDVHAGEKHRDEHRPAPVSETDQEVRRKKIRIVENSDAPTHRQEDLSGAFNEEPLSGSVPDETETSGVQNKKISIRDESADDAGFSISEEMLAGALSEVSSGSGNSDVYNTIESDGDAHAGHTDSAEKKHAADSSDPGAAADPKTSEEQPAKRSIKVKSTQ